MGVPDGARRLVFVALALALAGAGVFAFLRSGTADDAPAVEARRSAERAAEALGSKLTLEDLSGSMSQTRAETITSYVERRLLEGEESVTVWNQDAVVVFAGDASLIGTQDRRFRAQVDRALEDGTRSEVTNGSLHTLVPLPIGESDKPVVVAEVIQPNDAIASALSLIHI